MNTVTQEQAMKNDRHDWLRAAAKVPLLIAGLAFASAAFAHVFPQKQEPGAGATVASPAQVRVIFDGPLEPSFSSLTVTDASGQQVSTQKAAIDAHQPDTITLRLPSLAA